MEEVKRCPYCDEEILAIAKKCNHCGEWLVKNCPYCDEEILSIAVKCKHCGEWLNNNERNEMLTQQPSQIDEEEDMDIATEDLTTDTSPLLQQPSHPHKKWVLFAGISIVIIIILNVVITFFVKTTKEQEKNDTIVSSVNSSENETFTDLVKAHSLNNISNDIYYSVISKTFFYDSPDESTKRSGYLVQDDIVFIEKIENGFGYTVFKTTKGWLKMSTLIAVSENPLKPDLYKRFIEHNIIEVVDTALCFEYKILEFPSIRDKKLLNEIYSKSPIGATDYSKKGLLQALNEAKQNHEEQSNEEIEERGISYLSDYFSLNIVLINGNLVTIQYDRCWNVSGVGGCNGGKKYITFDKNSGQIIIISDILKNKDNNKAEWNKTLRKYVEDYDCVWEEGLIPVSDVFYFDKQTITFVYEKYEIACGDDGCVHITVPFSVIKNYLKTDFIAKYLNEL